MKIAQVAPLYESVPPRTYGGTERIVSHLTEGLVEMGHDVTLFASGDSTTQAKLIAASPHSLRDKDYYGAYAYHVIQLNKLIHRAHEFDIIHFHIDFLHYPFSQSAGYAHLTTLHGRLDMPDLVPIYKEFNRIPVVSVSDSQRQPVPDANWAGTVYHGIPPGLYSLGTGEGNYLAFLGRISPEKRPDRAIEIAKRAGMKLKIAAKVDNADVQYFKDRIRPLLDHPLVEFIGEIGEEEKEEFLGNARALLFPIDWPEPFGLVMIEAMACGTPVIAYNHGSVPEIIDEGKTGFIVESIQEAVAVIDKLADFDRLRCRAVFEKRYTVETMVNNYLKLYRQLIDQKAREGGGILSQPILNSNDLRKAIGYN